MELTAQEKRCVERGCSFLEQNLGGKWQLSQVLDQAIPDEPSPECIVTNGPLTAAVEVKRLLGSQGEVAYRAYWQSLMTKLAPDAPGHFHLIPPFDRTLPWSKEFIRTIRKAIAVAAPTIEVGGKGAIKVPRHAAIAKQSSAGSYVYCSHRHPSLTALTGQVPGQFYAADDSFHHEFTTEQAVKRFVEAVKLGCLEYESKAPLAVTWDDEWPLWRYEADYAKVEVTVPTHAFAVQPAVDECFWLMVSSAAKKFERDWANVNVVVLESRLPLADKHHIFKSIAGWIVEDFGKLDLILLVDDEGTTDVWRSKKFPGLQGGSAA